MESREQTGFLSLLHGVLFAPGRTFRPEFPAPGAAPALLTVALVATLGAVAAGSGAGPGVVLQAAARFAGTVVWLGLLAAVLGFSAELVGGKGRISRLWVLLGLTRAPALVMMPLFTLGQRWPAAGAAGQALAAIWTLVLVVLALRGAYRLSMGQSVAAVLLALGAAVVVPVALLALGALAMLAQPGALEALQGLGGG